MSSHIGLWVGFHVLILFLLILDLCVFHRKSHVIRFKEAVFWSAFWISLALAFNVGVYFYFGKQPALEFLSAYLLEKSLSVDNLFVFLLIFSYFKVSLESQHRVLFWGVIGALVMRGLFIMCGISLLDRFHWIMYLFGGTLIFTGFKLTQTQEQEIHPDRNISVRIVRKFFPVSKVVHGSRLFTRENDRWVATPLFFVLVVIETSDVLFAVDSIPAVLSLSRNAFIVYTSNIFAILGLRSLYFVIAQTMDQFYLVRYGLAIILIFVGVKMLFSDLFIIPISISLIAIASILLLSVLASIYWPKNSNSKG